MRVENSDTDLTLNLGPAVDSSTPVTVGDPSGGADRGELWNRKYFNIVSENISTY